MRSPATNFLEETNPILGTQSNKRTGPPMFVSAQLLPVTTPAYVEA
jgi:hypothetical protein